MQTKMTDEQMRLTARFEPLAERLKHVKEAKP
jgi:hypothetical protein